MSHPPRHAKISLRICLGDEVALGPGKADLLDAIDAIDAIDATDATDATGTIAGAGRRLGMSYKRAWTLVETMNRCFKSPLIETCKGGAERGGALLTPLGRAVLGRYRAMEAVAKVAVREDARYIETQLARSALRAARSVRSRSEDGARRLARAQSARP